MRSYSNLSLRDLLDAFASTAPAPAGGSATALAAATGVSLLVMAIGIRTSHEATSLEASELADAADRLRPLRQTITALIDRDAEAYTSVIAALRLPAGDDQSRERRRAGLESAIQTATDVPLETMRASRRALREAAVAAAQCVRSTSGDVGVAIELLHAAVRSAGITIDANLTSIRDQGYVSTVRAERDRLLTESAADAQYALSILSRQSA
jgi:formiminotetrahydrofolate cyclodeaminase